MTEPRSANYRMADRLAGKRLAQILAELRAEGLSGQAIARKLFADHGIETTVSTVLSWCEALEIPDPKKVAS